MADSLLLVLRVAVALAVVLALVWYLARRFGTRAGDRTREADVRVLDRQSLSRHTGVAVVAAGERRLLVGFADQGVALITELAPVPAPPEPEPADEPAVPAVQRVLDHIPLQTTPQKPLQKTVATRAATTTSARNAASGTPTGAPQGLLSGSVLSPSTWQATVRALQDRTVRR